MRTPLLLIMLFCMQAAYAEPVTVGIKDSKPFVNSVEIDSAEGGGIAIDLWETIAKQNDIEYVYKQYQTIDDLVAATAAGEVDIAVAPISITSAREDKVDFTHSYFQSGTSALTLSEDIPFYRLALAVAPNLAGVVFGGILIMIVLGLPFMFFEEKENDGVSNDKTGWAWFDAMYWVSATITTVGFGDVVPKTLAGRVYAIFVMWVGLIFTGMFIAYASNILDTTANEQINTIHDIRQPIGVLAGSYSEEFASANGIKVKRYTNGFEAISDLRRKRIGAFVHDKPILEYLARNEEGLEISQATFTSDNYGFALPIDSPYREVINKGLLSVVESSAWTKIVTSYK